MKTRIGLSAVLCALLGVAGSARAGAFEDMLRGGADALMGNRADREAAQQAEAARQEAAQQAEAAKKAKAAADVAAVKADLGARGLPADDWWVETLMMGLKKNGYPATHEGVDQELATMRQKAATGIAAVEGPDETPDAAAFDKVVWDELTRADAQCPENVQLLYQALKVFDQPSTLKSARFFAQWIGGMVRDQQAAELKQEQEQEAAEEQQRADEMSREGYNPDGTQKHSALL